MKLGDVITAILAMRIVIQFMAQAVGVVLLRKKSSPGELPFKMWFYPLPVILSLAIWTFLLLHNKYAIHGGIIALAGILVYYVVNRRKA
jgi:amino acid transporter